MNFVLLFIFSYFSIMCLPKKTELKPTILPAAWHIFNLMLCSFQFIFHGHSKCLNIHSKCNNVNYFLYILLYVQPEAAPARVTLGVTSLLTLSTQHAKSQASLPPVSYLKAVGKFGSVTLYAFRYKNWQIFANLIRRH